MSDDNDLIRLLAEIKRLALSKYPFNETDKLNPELCMTLGMIAGMCEKTIEKHRNNELS